MPLMDVSKYSKHGDSHYKRGLIPYGRHSLRQQPPESEHH